MLYQGVCDLLGLNYGVSEEADAAGLFIAATVVKWRRVIDSKFEK